MHETYATSEYEDSPEWPADEKQSQGAVGGHFMRLEKVVAQLQEAAGALEERVQTILTPEQETTKATNAEAGVPQALHSPVAMTLGQIVNKIERQVKRLENMRHRVEL